MLQMKAGNMENNAERIELDGGGFIEAGMSRSKDIGESTA